MKILAGDTSTSINTVAVCDSGRILAETFVDCGRGHAERLLDTVDWALAEAHLTFDDIDALAISAGPGSFTGLRVGVATWKGLAFGKNLPLVAVPTLDAMARLAGLYRGAVLPLLDARMGEVFGAAYRFGPDGRMKLTEDRACPVEELFVGLEGRVGVFGPGAERYRERILALRRPADFLTSAVPAPRAWAVAAEGASLLEQGVSTDPAAAAPVYLRKSQPEEADKGTPEGRHEQ